MKNLGEIIAHENPYREPVAGPFVVERRDGIGAPFDQNKPFTVAELSPHDPRWAEGVFVTLPGPGPELTTVKRCSKTIVVSDHCGREIIIGYVGGGGGM